jgi:hypothetical protein
MRCTATRVRSPLLNHARAIAAAIVGACAVYMPGSLLGQQPWTQTGNNLYPTAAATKVGIGTTAPSSLLEVNGTATIPLITGGINAGSTLTLQSTSGNGATGAAMMFNVGSNGNKASIRVFNNGHVTINNPVDNGNFYISGDSAGTQLLFDYNGSGDSYIDTTNTLHLRTTGSFTERVTLLSNGNVGIGTTTPLYLLSVQGKIGAQEVIVASNVGADYVFNPGYRLRPLTEVASYIKEHHHLPEIPSAAEVREKGLSIGEMQTKLLAKIEELTLHMIQADEKNRELQQRIAQLEARGVPHDH